MRRHRKALKTIADGSVFDKFNRLSLKSAVHTGAMILFKSKSLINKVRGRRDLSQVTEIDSFSVTYPILEHYFLEKLLPSILEYSIATLSSTVNARTNSAIFSDFKH